MKKLIFTLILILSSCYTSKYETFDIGERNQLEMFAADIKKSYDNKDVLITIDNNIKSVSFHQREGVLTSVTVEYWGEAFIGSCYVDSTGCIIQEQSARGYRQNNKNK